MEEARPMVCYFSGVMDSLIDKLTSLVDRFTEQKQQHRNKLKALRDDLKKLRDDPVNKLAGCQHKQVKGWMKQNRQLVYDIEDWTDLEPVPGSDEPKADFKEQINQFRAEIKKARERWERFQLAHKAATSGTDPVDVPSKKVAVDSQLLLEKKAVLDGIEDPRKELEKHLNDTETNMKVVTILGTGGLGKTTLAEKVYEELNGQFAYHASVTLGRNSSITALMDVFLQLNPEMLDHDTRASLNEQEVIPRLWEFLKDKRYFVVLDDIRNTHDWSVIYSALPNNDLRSRILTTTRIKDVAMSCSVPPTDVIYEMKGLDDGASKRLLSMIPAQTEANFGKICDDMLKMCSGLPLAIIVTAGLLALKSADLETLMKLEGYNLSVLGQHATLNEMRKVLDICFADLSPPVKACFLYLNTFPESCTIKKDRLIRRWVAEGFVPKTRRTSMWETGESYFNELICRKLIQPVFDDYNDHQAVICTVHRVIYDFISSLSREEDFHTTAAELIYRPFPYSTIRRFSVECSRQGNNEADTLKSSAVHLSRMRSLTVLGDAGSVPDLSDFKHLRVLDLEDTNTLDDQKLKSIEPLFLLRYLGLGGTNVTELPPEIMKFKHLSTLDLRRTSVMQLPPAGDTELVSVLGNGLVLPKEIGEMKKLEELSTVSLLPNDAKGLVNKSTKLRILGVTFGYVYIPTKTNQLGVGHLLEEVENSNLHSFFLDDYPCDSVGLLVKYWANKRPPNLQKFELRMSDYLRAVPQEMESLIALTHLHIRFSQLEAHVICALGKLPKLVLLNLFSRRGTQSRLTISGEDGFQCLKVFCFSCSVFLGMGLQFKKGAMPCLRRLKVDISARETKSAYDDFDFGIQNLCCLVQVRAAIRCKHATVSDAKDAEIAIRSQVSQIKGPGSSSTPSVDIRISMFPESSLHLPNPGPVSFVMEDAMVSASTGAMNSVLTKLATLMGKRYAEVTDKMNEQDLILRDELQLMNVLLKKLSDTPDLDIQMKECRNQMRELTYNIEDFIDDLMLPSANEEDSGTNEKREVLHNFIGQIRMLNAQVEEADIRSMVRKTEKRTSGLMIKKEWLSIDDARKMFADLSSEMKTCLLYLTSFPQYQEIRKDRVIGRWLAEGFLPESSVESCWETGERYFFELINRKLIVPCYDYEDDVLPRGCRVDYFVDNFITSQSSEENFVKPGIHGVFWRVSLETGSHKERQRYEGFYDKQKNSKVRSVTLHGAFGHLKMHDLDAFTNVRVLDIQDIRGPTGGTLYNVGYMPLLRYLRLAGSELSSLPRQIAALEHLETVDVSETFVKELPAIKSTKLVCLIGYRITLPTGMEEMQQVLEELSMVIVRNDGDRLAKVVNQSKRLRRLGVEICLVSEDGTKGLMDLLSAIGNSNIQYLRLDKIRYEENYNSLSVSHNDQSDSLLDLLLDCWTQQRPSHLKKLELRVSPSEVPRNMLPSLIDLTHLTIRVQKLDTEGLRILGNLPNLVFLSLKTKKMTERSIISNNGFRCLKVFWCHSFDDGMGLQFEPGAMPQLRDLKLEFSVKEKESQFGSTDFGIQFLTSLVKVNVVINCSEGSKAATVKDVEAAIRSQVSKNPNNPELRLMRHGEYYMEPDMVGNEGHASYVEDPAELTREDWLAQNEGESSRYPNPKDEDPDEEEQQDDNSEDEDSEDKDLEDEMPEHEDFKDGD